MKAGGGKPKGSAYERHVRDIFTKAYYPDKDGEFQRVDSKLDPKKGIKRSDLVALKLITIGDPLSKDPDRALVADRSFPFSIECKNYKGVKPLFCGLYSKDCEVWDWLKQAKESAGDKMPLVVFRLYRTSDIAMIGVPTFGRLAELFGIYKKKLFVIQNHEEDGTVQAAYLFILTDFLEWIDWGVFRLSHASRYIRSLVPKEEAHG